MDPTTIAPLASLLKDLGLLGALVMVLVGGSRRLWIWGWQHREAMEQVQKSSDTQAALLEAQLRTVEEDRDYYRDALMRALNVTEAFVGRK